MSNNVIEGPFSNEPEEQIGASIFEVIYQAGEEKVETETLAGYLANLGPDLLAIILNFEELHKPLLVVPIRNLVSLRTLGDAPTQSAPVN